MLLGLGAFVALHELDHVVLPADRIGNRLVGDLVEDIVEVVHRVDDLADVRLLDVGDRRVVERVDPPHVSGIDTVDVVVRGERMRPSTRRSLHGPPLE